jgi:hypothetical protein
MRMGQFSDANYPYKTPCKVRKTPCQTYEWSENIWQLLNMYPTARQFSSQISKIPMPKPVPIHLRGDYKQLAEALTLQYKQAKLFKIITAAGFQQQTT